MTDPATDAGDGTVNWTYSVDAAAVAYLAEGETKVEQFTVTVLDDAGTPLSDTATITITINGVNDGPVVQSSDIWMSSDPAQQDPNFLDGYPLLIMMPTDIDGDNLTITAEDVPSGVYYTDGTAVVNGDVLFDPDGGDDGIDLLSDLVYRPTSTIDDTPTSQLQLSVDDGNGGVVTQTVTINEVTPARVPGPTGDLSSGNKPLTSGRDSEVTLTIEDPFAATLRNDPADGNLIVKTNFQEWSQKGALDPTGSYYTVNLGDQNGDFLEAQVNVFIYVNGVQFQAVTANDAEANDWTYDLGSGLMAASIDFENINMATDPTTSLADYLAGQEPFAGDSWVVQYDDTTGGNEQARYVVFETEAFDPGDPGIIVDGNIVGPDGIYGTSVTDHLSGNGGDEIILGRAGDDYLDGGGGNDILVGGDGDDILFGGANNDTLTGDAGVDTFVFSSNAGEGSDSIEDFTTGLSGDILTFADLLDGSDPTLDEFNTDNVGVTVDLDDLILTIEDTDTEGGNPSTVVTLAGLGEEYADYNGMSLSDIINDTLSVGVDTINTDTYAS